MKKLIALMMILALMVPTICAAQLANPWTETNAEEMMERIGLSFYVPDGAENVVYRMLEEEQLAEVQFVLEGSECIARIKPAVEFEDISGMYYEWESEEECEILWCPGKVMLAHEDGQQISLCLWYDVVPGLMYSVGVSGEMNVLALTDALFVPAQGEVDVTPADALAQALMGCTGYAGTAGSSLKEAIAAVGLLEFAVGYAGQENLDQIVQDAMAALPEERKQELEFSFEGIGWVIDAAFADYESIAGLFDDAGVGEQAQEWVQTEGAQEQWNALIGLLRNAL